MSGGLAAKLFRLDTDAALAWRPCGAWVVTRSAIRDAVVLSERLLLLACTEKEGTYALQLDDAPAADFAAKVPRAATSFTGYDTGSVANYFQYYGKLANQQNMLQDHTRTGAYYNAILTNTPEFAGKVVMDVGAGSGILSYFSAMAGAQTVFAVEASAMAEVVRQLTEAPSNAHFGRRVRVLNQLLEDVREKDVPDKAVDVLVSEPIG